MRDELLQQYERELTFVRKMGAEFAEKYPKIASRLQLERDKCEDPHVERLIEAFSLLTARIRLKLDDELPEVAESLLGVVYPHYTAPIPSMSIVQLVPDPEKGKLTAGYTVDRGGTLHSKPVGGVPCKFRTCLPVTLWPVKPAEAALLSAPFGFTLPAGAGEATAALRLVFKAVGVKLSELGMDRMRFFLDGPPTVVHPLYELLMTSATRVVLRPGERQKNLRPFVLPPSAVRPVGFARDEAMLPYPARAFPGYRLLQEYFAFPDKFLFVDIVGIDEACKSGYTDTLEILVLLSRGAAQLESQVGPDNFRLGCTPIINLFRQTAEPIRVTRTVTEYPVIPDLRRLNAAEVYAIDSVVGTAPSLKAPVEYQPFYSFRHAYDRDDRRTFWYARRRPATAAGDTGTDMTLTTVDLGFNPSVPAAEVLTLITTCTNRDLPSKLPFAGEVGDFSLEGGGAMFGIRCLRKPTPSLRPDMGRGLFWRLISHLSLNYLSITDPAEGRDALREILKLYDFADSAATRRQITGIAAVSTKPSVGRTGVGATAGFCRGVDVLLELDEDNFVGAGVFLFASVLERFLGLYTSVNSFTRTTVRTKQREGDLKRWPPRAGEQTLL
jgi:type VI secretion system protein ImpG